MQAARKIPPGVRVSYQAVPFKPYVEELAKRGIRIEDLSPSAGKEKREKRKGKHDRS